MTVESKSPFAGDGAGGMLQGKGARPFSTFQKSPSNSNVTLSDCVSPFEKQNKMMMNGFCPLPQPKYVFSLVCYYIPE